MKKWIDYICLACWTIVLIAEIVTVSNGGQIASSLAIISTLVCFLNAFVAAAAGYASAKRNKENK